MRICLHAVCDATSSRSLSQLMNAAFIYRLGELDDMKKLLLRSFSWSAASTACREAECAWRSYLYWPVSSTNSPCCLPSCSKDQREVGGWGVGGAAMGGSLLVLFGSLVCVGWKGWKGGWGVFRQCSNGLQTVWITALSHAENARTPPRPSTP